MRNFKNMIKTFWATNRFITFAYFQLLFYSLGQDLEVAAIAAATSKPVGIRAQALRL